jgi:serine protease Do
MSLSARLHAVPQARRAPLALVVAACVTVAASPAGAVEQSVLDAEARRVASIERASATAVAIFAGEAGGGSGVLISPDGYALTNFHVVQPAGPALRCGLDDGRLYDAVLVGLDPTGDVALIRLLGRDDFPVAPFGESDLVRPGDACFAAGNPFLLATDLRPSISAGIVSGVRRYQFPAGTILEYTDCLQVDAAINPGNSGGGLFDRHGRLIGVNGRASFEKRGRVNVGVGYAISARQLRQFLGCLRGGRLVDHATLGATVASSADGRVVVSDILETSDAWRRGLRYDDEVVSLAGRPVRTVNAFKNVLGTLPAGWQVPLVYRRGGARIETLVRLAAVHAPAELAAIVAGDKRPERGPRPEPLPQGPHRERAAAATEMPAAVRALYEPRPGFTNHAFNVVERDRVAAAIAAVRRGPATPWRLTGRRAEGGGFTVVLGAAEASIDLPTGRSVIDPRGDLDATADPPGSGGLLAALSLWRRLLLGGPADLGATSYWGTAPLFGHPDAAADETATASFPLLDVLESAVAGVVARFFVNGSGHVVGIDLWLAPDTDPCEVRLAPPAAGADAWEPRAIVVRRGTEPFATLLIAPAEAQP